VAIIKETQWSSFCYEYLDVWVCFKNSASSSALLQAWTTMVIAVQKSSIITIFVHSPSNIQIIFSGG